MVKVVGVFVFPVVIVLGVVGILEGLGVINEKKIFSYLSEVLEEDDETSALVEGDSHLLGVCVGAVLVPLRDPVHGELIEDEVKREYLVHSYLMLVDSKAGMVL